MQTLQSTEQIFHPSICASVIPLLAFWLNPHLCSVYAVYFKPDYSLLGTYLDSKYGSVVSDICLAVHR